MPLLLGTEVARLDYPGHYRQGLRLGGLVLVFGLACPLSTRQLVIGKGVGY